MTQLTFLLETSQSASKNATLTQCSLYMSLIIKSGTWGTLSWNTRNCWIKFLRSSPDVAPVILCIEGLLPQSPYHFATLSASLTNFSVFLTNSHDFNYDVSWKLLAPTPICVQKHTDLLAFYFGHCPDLWHQPLLPNCTSALSWRHRGINPPILVYRSVLAHRPSCCSCLNRADVIKVFDGRSSSAPVITVLCNEGSELEVLSTGPDLYIEFVANSEWPGQGFKASFQFQAMDSITSDSPSTGQWSWNFGISRVHK